MGSHLAADQRRRGRKVAALDVDLSRVRALAEPGAFELFEGDVADRERVARALRGVDTVFHLAAAHLSVTAPEAEYARVNVEAVRMLLDAAREAGVRRFVHTSTVGVHGVVQDPPADEDAPLRPEFAYERTKLAGERVVRAAFPFAPPAVILRPVWVYGPGCHRTEKLFRSIARRRFFLAGDGRALRHCIYIRDMLEAYERAAVVPGAVGQVLVVGDAGAVEVRTLVAEIARLTGAPMPRSVPLPLLYATGLAAEALFRPLGKEPPLSRRSLRFFTGNTSFRTDRARSALGWEPRYDLRAGLAETHALLRAGVGLPLPEPVPA
jgi:nucleoside-diphosphate-sugar epimerase